MQLNELVRIDLSIIVTTNGCLKKLIEQMGECAYLKDA